MSNTRRLNIGFISSCIRTHCSGFCWSEYLRWTCQPCCYIWCFGWRSHYVVERNFVLDCSVTGSVAACLLLKFATGGMEIAAFSLSAGVSSSNAVVFEIVMTFGLVYTVYATAVDPKKGNLGTIAPIAIGFIVGANILVGGAFEGASMNPAVSFGPAVVSWTWTNHWVYWLGPFIGAALAAIIYDTIFIGENNHEQLPTTDY